MFCKQSEDARLQYSSDEDNEREAVNITLEDEANNYVAFLGNLVNILLWPRASTPFFH